MIGSIIKLVGFGPLKWLNPLWGAVMTVVEWVIWAIKKFIEGTLSFLTNPVETFAVVVLCLISLAMGLHWGVAWDSHLVDQAEARLAAVASTMEGMDDTDEARAGAAIEARRAAELEPLSLIGPGPGPVAKPASTLVDASTKRVRKPKAKVYRRIKKPKLPSVQDDRRKAWGP